MIMRYNEAIAMAQETLLPDRPKRTKEWYQLSLTELQKAQERTRAAFHNYMLKTTKKTKSALKAARDDEKAAFKEAKDKWVKQKCGHIDNHYYHQFHTAKEAWDAISDLVLSLIHI